MSILLYQIITIIAIFALLIAVLLMIWPSRVRSSTVSSTKVEPTLDADSRTVSVDVVLPNDVQSTVTSPTSKEPANV